MVVNANIIGRQQLGGVPFKSDLTFYSKTREYTTLVADIGDDASVVGRVVGVLDGASSIEIDDSSFSEVQAFDITAYIYPKSLTGDQTIFSYKLQAESGHRSGFSLRLYNNKLRLLHMRSLTSASVYDSTSNFLSINTWYKVRFVLDSGTIYFYVNDELSGQSDIVDGVIFYSNSVTYPPKTLIGSQQTQNIDGLFFNGDTSDLKFNGLFEYYLNGHAYDSITGIAATNNGVTFEYDKTVSPLIGLENDYYLDGSGNQIINPKYAQTTETLFEGGSFHNLFGSFIRFPLGGFFDRSDTTIWNSNARDSIYYDSSNPTDFHIDELNQYTISSYLNVGYRGKFYNYFDANSIDDRNFMKELMLYGTDKTGQDEIKVLTYTKDIAKAISDGAGSYITDENGYVTLTE